MKLEQKEIDKFRFDPFDPTTLGLLEKEHEAYRFSLGKVDKRKAITYLILCYDLHSPLIKRYPDIIDRKIRAAELSEFEKTLDGKFKEGYENLITGENDQFNDIIFQYISSFGSPEFVALVMYWSLLADEYKNASKITDSKERKDVIANTQNLLTKIKDLTQILFSGEEVMNIRIALYKGAEKRFRALTPEFIASATEEELDENIGKPYGKKYKPSKIKFIGNK
jgi:hypothetical protein